MVGPSRMTLASDRPPAGQVPLAGPREIQRTLRVSVGSATGHVDLAYRTRRVDFTFDTDRRGEMF